MTVFVLWHRCRTHLCCRFELTEPLLSVVGAVHFPGSAAAISADGIVGLISIPQSALLVNGIIIRAHMYSPFCIFYTKVILSDETTLLPSYYRCTPYFLHFRSRCMAQYKYCNIFCKFPIFLFFLGLRLPDL